MNIPFHKRCLKISSNGIKYRNMPMIGLGNFQLNKAAPENDKCIHFGWRVTRRLRYDFRV